MKTPIRLLITLLGLAPGGMYVAHGQGPVIVNPTITGGTMTGTAISGGTISGTAISGATGAFVPGGGGAPPVTISSGVGPAFPPTPTPSLWIFGNLQNGTVFPNICQQLFEQSSSGSPFMVSQSHWGIATGPAIGPAQVIKQFSVIQKKGDAVINVEGGDLILAAQTRGNASQVGGQIRFSTTTRLSNPPQSPLPIYRDYERMTITDTGWVGIGTNQPRYQLEVAARPPSGGNNPGTILALYDSSATYGGIAFISDPGVDFSIGKKTVDAAHTYFQIRRQQGQEFVTVDRDGNVGIGNSAPRDQVEFGDKFTLNSGGWKYLGYNFRWDPQISLNRRIDDNLTSSRVAFTDGGEIQLDSWPVDANPHDAVYLEHGNHFLVGQTFVRAWNDDDGEIVSFRNSTSTTPGGNYFKHKVYIGTTDPGLTPSNDTFKLAVNGSVKAKEVVVDCATWTAWPDYVFEEGYHLKPLPELETILRNEHHLPGIPSAEEVRTGGVSLGNMQAKVLEKIEELTLYMIALEKENRELRDRLTKLEGRSGHEE